MASRRRLALAVAVVIGLASRATSADPAPSAPPPDFLHVVVPWHLTTDGGTKLDLPPSYVLADPKYDALDAEMKRLQNVETHDKAEIDALHKDLEKWQPGWVTLGAAIVGGLVLGYYVHDKL